jgi:signal transduction histidine kinase
VDAEIGCIFTKALIPFVEREVGPEGVDAILEAAGRPREWLIAEYNSLPLPLADRLVRVSMALTGETDEEQWARRYAESFMDWKPSRDERAWGGVYTMSFGSPRAIYANSAGAALISGLLSRTLWTVEVVELRRRRAVFRITPSVPHPPRWACTWNRVCYERYPTNWGLPRAHIVEHGCATRGDPACVWEVRWRNAGLGRRFWIPTLVGAAASVAAAGAAVVAALPALATGALAALPAICGTAIGAALLKDQRHRQADRLLALQREELLHSSRHLETKFRDLERKIEQLSLLADLSRAVNATLDVETIYRQALDRLVHGMGYQVASLFVVEPARGVLRGHRMVGFSAAADAAGVDAAAGGASFDELEIPIDDRRSVTAKAAATGQIIVIDDLDARSEPMRMPVIRAIGIRSLVALPLRVNERVFGVLNVSSREPHAFGDADVEVLSAVASQVSLAVHKAEGFRTIEELSRGLEEKVRVRTEQLRTANEDLSAAYRELQQTQMQLVQREKMASVGQLVAGVAHELNNPIGFVYSNVATLEDFVRRLRAMLDAYRAAAWPETERAGLQARWDELKVDYALRYLDNMTQGIREGAERARKIVRDLRVFARTDDVWQPVDLHEEIESSLTLLNHLLKDRVTVHRKFGALPPVECVRSQIDQVFLNVLANAAQAIDGPGEVTIETRREGDAAVVTIRDTGRGIAPDVIGRIFDPFFTTKPVGEGTGLGLSISYEIVVKKHGGQITAESHPGGGTAVTVKLPLGRGR